MGLKQLLIRKIKGYFVLLNHEKYDILTREKPK